MDKNTKNKMENPTFVDEENIPLINQVEDYDNYPDTTSSRVGETSFTVPDASEATSTLKSFYCTGTLTWQAIQALQT